VAWQRHLTPTACAAFLVERVRAWCDRRDDLLRRCLRSASTATDRATDAVARAHGRLDGAAGRALDRAEVGLAHRQARAAAQDPARLLARGWSITHTAGGQLVTSPDQAPPGTVLHTTTADGAVRSRVPTTEDR
jgi:exonuclease VII large subunit